MTITNSLSNGRSTLCKKLFSSIICGVGVLSTLSVVHAQDVTFQENLAGGVGGASVTLTVQNYAPGSALTNSNFVSFSFFNGLFSTSVSSSEFFSPSSGLASTTLSGSLSTANPAADTVYLVAPAVGGPDILFSQEGDQVTFINCYPALAHCQTGNGAAARTVLYISPSGFQPISAPEMDLNSAGSALTLLLGGLLVLKGGFRRS